MGHRSTLALSTWRPTFPYILLRRTALPPLPRGHWTVLPPQQGQRGTCSNTVCRSGIAFRRFCSRRPWHGSPRQQALQLPTQGKGRVGLACLHYSARCVVGKLCYARSMATWDQLVTYEPNFLRGKGAEKLICDLRDLADTSRMVQPNVKLYGREHPTPRLMRWFAADSSMTYSWSGVTLHPEPLPPCLKILLGRVSGRCNSVLLNMYRDGRDYIGWHSDDEPELGPEPTVHCYSLGAYRDFVLRRKDDHKNKRKICLADNSLVTMFPRCQEIAQHSIPKRAKAGWRASFTMRQIDSSVDCAQCARPCTERAIGWYTASYACSEQCYQRLVARMTLQGASGFEHITTRGKVFTSGGGITLAR